MKTIKANRINLKAIWKENILHRSDCLILPIISSFILSLFSAANGSKRRKDLLALSFEGSISKIFFMSKNRFKYKRLSLFFQNISWQAHGNPRYSLIKVYQLLNQHASMMIKHSHSWKSLFKNQYTCNSIFIVLKLFICICSSIQSFDIWWIQLQSFCAFTYSFFVFILTSI